MYPCCYAYERADESCAEDNASESQQLTLDQGLGADRSARSEFATIFFSLFRSSACNLSERSSDSVELQTQETSALTFVSAVIWRMR